MLSDTLPEATDRLEPGKLSCMEVWGGNESTWSSFIVPGLDMWIYCRPLDNQESGGDVYYVSSCASGRLTRFLLGDVSGHGAEAAPHARTFHDIMRRNVNHMNQDQVVDALNDEFEKVSSVGRFATAIVGTYFAPTRMLTLCSAGHPPPLRFCAKSQSWTALASDSEALRNLPLGVMESHQFRSTKIRLETDDLMLCYSDALFDACGANGSPLRADGLAALAQTIPVAEPAEFVNTFLNTIRLLHPDNLQLDDTTVVLARANLERVSLKDNLISPFRFLKGLLVA